MGTRPLAVAALALLLPVQAHAHGLWGHIHVTGWAVENMPDDELRAFLLEPEVFNALLFGAAFTDTGYGGDTPESRAYAEHTHWEPFIQDYIDWIRANDPPPWTSSESKRRVAFLMGCASHGLQDEVFDTLFLHQVNENDGGGQDEADPGTDGFLALDGHLRFVPEEDIPMETVLALYEELPEDITEEVIQDSVDLVTNFYINGEFGLAVAEQLGEQYADQIPWTREHYLDADIPGSHRSEVYPTMAYQQAIWQRLHEGLPAGEATTYAWPEAPRRLLSGASATVGSSVTLVFGVGVRYEEGLVELFDADGAPVPATQMNSRWGPEWTRMIRLAPDVDLTPGAWYTARMGEGIETIDGQISDAPFELTFQVTCDDATADACEDLGDIPEADIDGMDVEEDGDTADTGAPDDTEEGCGCGGGDGAAAAIGALALAAGRRRRR
jgi:uncharacterized protein (TIGR03382 family)